MFTFCCKNQSFLSNNDTIVVVSSKKEITVSGAVYNPTKILYSKPSASIFNISGLGVLYFFIKSLNE